MRGMTVEATDIAAGMGRLCKMRLLAALTVTSQAARAGLLARLALKKINFRFVAAARHMFGARPVAPFATLMRGATFRVERGLPMRRLFPTVVDFFVTGLAGVRANIFGFFGRGRAGRGNYGGLTAFVA